MPPVGHCVGEINLLLRAVLGLPAIADMSAPSPQARHYREYRAGTRIRHLRIKGQWARKKAIAPRLATNNLRRVSVRVCQNPHPATNPVRATGRCDARSRRPAPARYDSIADQRGVGRTSRDCVGAMAIAGRASRTCLATFVPRATPSSRTSMRRASAGTLSTRPRAHASPSRTVHARPQHRHPSIAPRRTCIAKHPAIARAHGGRFLRRMRTD